MSKARRMVAAAANGPRLRRTYFDCRYGQMHLHYAIPAGGGFGEATTLLCVPGAAGTGVFFRPLLLPLGRDRSVYAPDLVGCGASDSGPEPLDASGQAEALGDFLDVMHLREIDLLAHEEGVPIALELARQRPDQVGRVVLSPDSEPVRAAARTLRQRALVIDLGAAGPAGPGAANPEQQAGRLREFLGLA